MKIYLGIFAALILALSSCEQESAEEITINGVWQSIGYGLVLEITDSTQYSFYDVTAISCLPSRSGALSEIESSLELRNDTLSLLVGVINIQFVKADQRPALCNQTLDEEKASDPLYNFEVFAETVKEHYAFMALNGIDWDALYSEQKSKLNAQSTEAELYLVIEEALEKLNDNHAFLEAPDEVYDAIDELVPEQEEEIDTLPEYGDFPVAQMVAEHHLQEEMTEDSWLMHWGKLTDEIGYIQIKAMWLYADIEMPEALIEELGYVDAFIETRHKMYEGDYIAKEVAGASATMDQVMNDLASMESIVIDVRFNGGGQDAVSSEILSRFIPQKTQVATQKVRYGDHFTSLHPFYIEGRENAYTKPVYILTSPQTGSAAEAFAIASLPLKNVVRIGSATAGALSTSLEKTLPNGWVFSISNEIYMDNHGNAFENLGVPVNHELHYPKDRQTFFRSIVDDLEKDKREILQALEH